MTVPIDGGDRLKSFPVPFADNFERLSGFSQWLFWLVTLCGSVVSVTLCFFFDFSIFGSFSLSDLGIYTILFGFAFGTLYMSFKDARFIDRETGLATQQVELLLRTDDVAEFLALAEKSIFRTHIDSLYRIFLIDQEISQDNLIEILHTRLLARNKIVELLSGVLITLGLIGTVVGLILMTNDLGSVIASAGDVDPAVLMARIGGSNGPLGSLGVAFYTTLIGGLFGGVMLRILSGVVEASITRYTAHIAELTEVNVLPFMRQLARNLEAAGYYTQPQSKTNL